MWKKHRNVNRRDRGGGLKHVETKTLGNVVVLEIC